MPGAPDGGLPELTSHLVLVRNQSSENAPAFAALEVTGFDADTGAYLVTKPTRANLTTVLFNGSQAVEAGEEGQASGNRYSVAAWADDGSGEEPAAGDAWGTEADNWFLVRRSTGFKVIDLPEGADYETVLVEPTDLTPVGTVEVTSAAANGAGPDDLYYPAKLVAFDPADRTWSTVRDPVWFHVHDAAVPAVGDRVPCVHEGFGSGRPVYGNRLPDPGGLATGCTPAGWAWAIGLWPNECLYFEVLSKSGACSAIDATQWAYLKYDSGTKKWLSKKWNCATLLWEDWSFAYDGGSGQLKFSVDAATGLPKLEVDGAARVLSPVCGGPGVVVFSLGGPDFCGGGGSTGEADCDNIVEVRVTCVCCPIDGWQGDGWYRIQDVGVDCATDPCTVAHLTVAQGDPCRTDIVICSCRFDTEAEATADCPAPTTTPCQGLNVATKTVSATYSNKTGDCTCLPTNPTTNNYGTDQLDVHWIGCPGNFTLSLRCSGGIYTLTTATGGIVITPVSAVAGPPLVLVWDISGYGANCGGAGGTARLTITIS